MPYQHYLSNLRIQKVLSDLVVGDADIQSIVRESPLDNAFNQVEGQAIGFVVYSIDTSTERRRKKIDISLEAFVTISLIFSNAIEAILSFFGTD